MIRKTNQRSVIAEVLEEAEHPLSVAEVLALAQSKHASLGIATVYRTLKAMVEAGAIVTVDWPGDAPRYERSGKHHHHHFQCRKCGGMFDVEGCAPGISALVPKGFRLESHEILLYGVCDRCQKSGTA